MFQNSAEWGLCRAEPLIFGIITADEGEDVY